MPDLKVGSIVLIKNILSIKYFKNGSGFTGHLVFDPHVLNVISSTKEVSTKDILDKKFIVSEIDKVDFQSIVQLKPAIKNSGIKKIIFYKNVIDDIQSLNSILEVVGTEIDISKVLPENTYNKIVLSRKNIDKLFFIEKINKTYDELCLAIKNIEGIHPRDYKCDCGKKVLDGHMVIKDINDVRLKAIKEAIVNNYELSSENDITSIEKKSIACVDSDVEIIVFKIGNDNKMLTMPIDWLQAVDVGPL